MFGNSRKKDTMNKFERIHAAISGQALDRWAYALWRHFPGEDRPPQGFAEAHVRFNRTYEPDILKLSPHGHYCTVDWGCEPGPTNSVYGSTTAISFPIKVPADFENLEEIDPLDGEFGLQVEGVRRVAKLLHGDVPLLMTVFSPLMVAGELDPAIIKHVNEAESQVETGVKTISDVMTCFAHAVLDAGADGLFIASQH
ncbi:MAG: uroporphyrinogen decarboxylase family protein, partial [Candidatus Ranarchaeia archaeon]